MERGAASALARSSTSAGVDVEPEQQRFGSRKSRVSPPDGSTPSTSVRHRKPGRRLTALKRLSRNHNSADRTSTSSSSNGRYFALYDYIPQADEELELRRGFDVEILSKDKRKCGDKNWWMGRSNGQIGIFPSSYVVEKTRLDRVNIHLPMEIDFDEMTQVAVSYTHLTLPTILRV